MASGLGVDSSCEEFEFETKSFHKKILYCQTRQCPSVSVVMAAAAVVLVVPVTCSPRSGSRRRSSGERRRWWKKK